MVAAAYRNPEPDRRRLISRTGQDRDRCAASNTLTTRPRSKSRGQGSCRTCLAAYRERETSLRRRPVVGLGRPGLTSGPRRDHSRTRARLRRRVRELGWQGRPGVSAAGAVASAAVPRGRAGAGGPRRRAGARGWLPGEAGRGSEGRDGLGASAAGRACGRGTGARAGWRSTTVRGCGLGFCADPVCAAGFPGSVPRSFASRSLRVSLCGSRCSWCLSLGGSTWRDSSRCYFGCSRVLRGLQSGCIAVCFRVVFAKVLAEYWFARGIVKSLVCRPGVHRVLNLWCGTRPADLMAGARSP